MPPDDCIVFEPFVKLLHSISRVKPRSTKSVNRTNDTPTSLQLVDRWLKELRQYDSSQQTCKIFFRLLFPEEDVRRRYNLKETALARSLADVFGLSTGRHGAGRIFLSWSEQPTMLDDAKLGCLGAEVEKVLLDRHSNRRSKSPSIQKIDLLLDELASLSAYSNLGISVPCSKRPRVAILKDLFLDLDPVEAKFLTQIILKDLRPVLYPLAETHTTRALLNYNSKAIHELSKWEVMKIWNSWMPQVYRARATLDEAAKAVENLASSCHVTSDHEAFFPVIGVPVEIPKSRKALSLSHALGFFRVQSHDLWAETKYDGERMQIHIDTGQSPSRQIQIFSKSKRDSTLDRIGTHPIIRAALNLPPLSGDCLIYPALGQRKIGKSAVPIVTSLILDAEMVCYSESKRDIDEFWRLRSLIESTAHGVRRSKRYEGHDCQDADLGESPEDMITDSLQSNASDNGDRHFMLVFFDILSLNGSSLLDQDYDTRREHLEQLITKIPGFVSLSYRQRISFSGGFTSAVKMLAKEFSTHIADRQEGLVLKAAKSRYHDFRLPWVKLKRDYIPGYGDTVDLVILGAGWNKDRARELRVSSQTFTTFFVAALENPLMTRSQICAARFHVLFSVEYGLSRQQLEAFNMYIKTTETHPYCHHMPTLEYTFTLSPSLTKPRIMFSAPILTELFGAGFTKHAGAKYYALRFPRITKVWQSNERGWTEGVTLDKFQSIARLSIGRESSEEWANRTVEAMWGCDVDFGPEDPRKIIESSNEWYRKLLKSEKLQGEETPVSSYVKMDNRESPTSTTRRKVSPTRVTEPPAKRQKLQTYKAHSQPLQALGSMTNIIDVDADRQPQSNWELNQTPKTPCQMKTGRSQNIREGPELSVSAIQQDTSHTMPDSSHPSETEFIDRPPCTSTSLHASPNTPRPSKSKDFREEFEAAQCTPGHPLIPRTLPRISNNGSSLREVKRDVALQRHWPSKYAHSPMLQFLREAYVWIPRDANNRRPLNRPPAVELVPQNRRIKVIYFLLIICGCRVGNIQATAEQFEHVNKCVIFVNTGHGPGVQEGLNWLFCALESWKTELSKPGAKELFVFDTDMITYRSLATFKGDVTSQALWKSSREVNPSKMAQTSIHQTCRSV